MQATILAQYKMLFYLQKDQPRLLEAVSYGKVTLTFMFK